MQKSDIYIQHMLSFVHKAGKIALGFLGDCDWTLKKDKSVMTKADGAISKLAHTHLAEFLKQPGHILIDEEDPDIKKSVIPSALKKASMIWALDPIDGTRLYANQIPLFGISLGLIKDLRPWLGVVYFPMLKELFYCDGVDAYFVKEAFSPKEIKTKIVPYEEELSARSLFLCNDTFFDHFYWKDKDFHIMILACAVINLCWPTIGRGVGGFLRAHLWDFAGSWPILRKAGLDLRRSSDGKVLDILEPDLFQHEPLAWFMKEYYVVCSKAHYPLIVSKIGQFNLHLK